MKRAHSIQNGTFSERITERERQILMLIADHRSNKEVAASLHLALSTVKWYSQQIFSKLEVRNRREAVERALELGLLDTRQNTTIPNNLPSPITHFVGREDETEEIVRFLVKGGSRLLTLHGPGGSGKTRLAIQAASLLLESAPDIVLDGVWFISLTSLQNSASILHTIASTIGYNYFDREKELLQQLLDYLRHRRFLLLLDNFEHLISEKSIHLLTEIITHAPHGKLLITSRTRLGVLGEQSFQVMGMQVPETGNELAHDWRSFSAMQLFLGSARRVQQEFEINDKNVVSIIRICQLVEGMPLGLEMATAWLELFTPQEIVTGIEHSLDFLQVPTSEKRHQSLRIVFDTSWKLLSDQEQSCLQALTVFRGSFTREAAQRVSGAARETFLSLINKSWLARESGGRYHIHELLRQYGYENLQQHPVAWNEARDAHARYYAGLLHTLGEEMKGFHQVQAFDLSELEFENLRAAWILLTEQGEIKLLIEQILLGLFLYSEARWRTSDCLQLVRQAQQKLDQSPANDHTITCNAILTLAEVAFFTEFFSLRETGSSELLWGKGLSVDRVTSAWDVLCGKTVEEVNGFWLIISAHLHAWPTDPAAGLQRLKALREIFTQQGETWLQGVAGFSLARVISGYGYWYTMVSSQMSIDEHTRHHGEVSRVLRESLRCFRSTGDSWKQAYTLQLLAEFAEDARAQITLLGQAKELFDKVGDITTSSLLLYNLAEIHKRLGNTNEAFQYFQEQQRIFRWLGNRRLLANSLSWESIESLRHDTLPHARQARHECIAILEELLSETRRASENSDHMEIEYAWALYELGEIERVDGNLEAARKDYAKAGEVFDREGISAGQAFYHYGMGQLALSLGEYQTAGEHFDTSVTISRSAPHAWIEVCALCGAARAAVGLRRHEAARNALAKGLGISNILDHRELFMLVFAGWASLHLAENRLEPAIELASLVFHHFASWKEVKQQARYVMDEACAQLPSTIAQSAKERGKNMGLESILRKYLAVEQAGQPPKGVPRS